MARYDQIGLGVLIQPRVSIGQRNIGFPVSPVSRLFAVPQAVPIAPVLYQAPPAERLPEQAMVDPSTISRTVNRFLRDVRDVLRRPPVMGATYRIVNPNGVRTFMVDYRARSGSVPVANLSFGTLVRITANAGDDWYRISNPFDGLIQITSSDLEPVRTPG